MLSPRARIALGFLSYFTLALFALAIGYALMLDDLTSRFLDLAFAYLLAFHILPALWVARDVRLHAPHLRWRAYPFSVLRYGLGYLFVHYLPARAITQPAQLSRANGNVVKVRRQPRENNQL